MIHLLRWILLPASLIYQFIIWTRNILYDKGIFKSQSFSIPTIVIGNLAIGGTGKSPMTEYLIRLLHDKYKIATLSRGYGRKTKGFKYVEIDSTALEIGDEPLQFKRKFPKLTVAVSEDRCYGVNILQDKHDLIILDDAYQHRKLNPGYSILLFDFQSLFQTSLTLPTGNFRDNFSASKRASLIIITKCPDYISDKQKQHIEHKIRKHNNCPIFYTKISYSTAVDIRGNKLSNQLEKFDILLLSGIANPKPLISHLSKQNTVHTIVFPDHHNYSLADFEKVKKSFDELQSSNKIIITTEKDMQRIDDHVFANYPLYYIPIELQSVDKQQLTFDHFIENYLNSVNEY